MTTLTLLKFALAGVTGSAAAVDHEPANRKWGIHLCLTLKEIRERRYDLILSATSISGTIGPRRSKVPIKSPQLAG